MNQKFIQYRPSNPTSAMTPPTFPPGAIFQMSADREGRMWLMTEGTLSRDDAVNVGVGCSGSERPKVVWSATIHVMNNFSVTPTIRPSQPSLPNHKFKPSPVKMMVIYGSQHPIYSTISRRSQTGRVPKLGLSNTFIVSIEQDQAGNLWLGTQHGLIRFDQEQAQFRTDDVPDSLQDDIYTRLASWHSPTGRLFFGGSSGISAFAPTTIGEAMAPVPVTLTGMRLLNLPVSVGERSPLPRAIWAANSLTRQPDQMIFSFEFATLNFAVPQPVALDVTMALGIWGIEPPCTNRSQLKVPRDTAVVFCYTVHNQAAITQTVHTLTDSQWGTLLDKAPLTKRARSSILLVVSDCYLSNVRRMTDRLPRNSRWGSLVR